MRRIQMPNEAKKIIDTLYSEGYEAYIVGGCVRDALIGRVADDYDITTSAPPSEVKRIFAKTVDTGIEHGTVTVIENGKPYEVTTFRVDGEYKDNRHPVSILFTSRVEDDLARRDFTVNALAYNDRVGIVDAFFGIEDLDSKIIRCVRNPEERFAEDALRVLRGIRFSSVLSFDIEKDTADAILKYAKNLKDVSSERIFIEWKKLLSGARAYEVISEFKEVVDVFAYELKNVLLPPRESFCGLSWDEREMALFYGSPSPRGAFETFAKRIKMDSKTRDTSISVLNSIAELSVAESLGAFLIGKSDEVSLKAAKIAVALGVCDATVYEKINSLIEADSPRKIAHLNINGNDLIERGVKGEAIGKILNEALYLVATNELPNERVAILDKFFGNK